MFRFVNCDIFVRAERSRLVLWGRSSFFVMFADGYLSIFYLLGDAYLTITLSAVSHF